MTLFAQLCERVERTTSPHLWVGIGGGDGNLVLWVGYPKPKNWVAQERMGVRIMAQAQFDPFRPEVAAKAVLSQLLALDVTGADS